MGRALRGRRPCVRVRPNPPTNHAGASATMATTLHHFVNGQAVPGSSGRFADVFNPATGEVSSRVPLANAAELDRAVQAAAAAFPAWSAVTPLQRARVMFRFKALVEANLDRLAALVTAEHGKV